MTTPMDETLPKPKKPKSRSKRWAEAVSAADRAVSNLEVGLAQLQEAMEELKSVQSEYEEWKDNLPENLASSALGEKLEEVCNLDMESAADAVESAIDDARSLVDETDGIDLPQGFGRD